MKKAGVNGTVQVIITPGARAVASVVSGSMGISREVIAAQQPFKVCVTTQAGDDLEALHLAEAVRTFKLPEEAIRANLARLKPPQRWYDEDEDLFGE